MALGRGFGVAGTLDHEIVARVAAAAEQSGYRTFWANDTPGGEGLAALAAAARATSSIRLGVGVIPVDRTTPERIVARVRELMLPEERLVIGLGAGAVRAGAVALVRDAIQRLRGVADIRVFVGALGPRMCALAGEEAAGVLLNWLTPAAAGEAAARTREAAGRAARPAPEIAAYVRVALPAGWPRLKDEAARYARLPQYAAHFQRIGSDPLGTCAHGEPPEVQAMLAQFDAVLDETVVRAVTPVETLADYLALIAAASARASD